MNEMENITASIARIEAKLDAQTSPWLNRHDAAEYARCSTSDIDKARHEGRLPVYWWHGSPRFRKSDIDRVITTNPNPTQSNPDGRNHPAER